MAHRIHNVFSKLHFEVLQLEPPEEALKWLLNQIIPLYFFLVNRGKNFFDLCSVEEFHLYSLLLQVDAVGQVLSGDDIWVLVLVEKGLQGL